MRAMDVMTTEVVSVGPDTTVQDLAKLISERGISGVPVVENGRLVGIVSEGDLLHRAETGTERRTQRRRWRWRGLADDLYPRGGRRLRQRGRHCPGEERRATDRRSRQSGRGSAPRRISSMPSCTRFSFSACFTAIPIRETCSSRPMAASVFTISASSGLSTAIRAGAWPSIRTPSCVRTQTGCSMPGSLSAFSAARSIASRSGVSLPKSSPTARPCRSGNGRSPKRFCGLRVSAARRTSFCPITSWC
jgi:hypothetical protein